MDSGASKDFYKPAGATATAEAPRPKVAKANSPAPPAGGTVSWTASEYIEHDRNSGWYMGLVLLTLALAAAIFAITRDYISIVVIIALGWGVGVFARRQPRQIAYQLSESGVKIGEKIYRYGDFQSFAVNTEDEMPSITLMPIKKFMPAITIFFAPQDEELIISALGEHLPAQEHKRDHFDRLSRKLKF